MVKEIEVWKRDVAEAQNKGTDCELTSSGVGLPSAACAMLSTATDACKRRRAHADRRGGKAQRGQRGPD